MNTKIKVAVIGASGYTGADVVRLLLTHPMVEIGALVANSHAGKKIESVFPQFTGCALPPMQSVEEIDWQGFDVAICGLPHATAQDVICQLPQDLKIIDMSADFRLRDVATYEEWYGRKHNATDLLKTAVYGLTEHNREAIKLARLVACPGCYPTATLLLLLPLVREGLIETDDLIIDAKSGVSGAGRSLKESALFCEVAEGAQAYSVASHRHAPEIEQELSLAANKKVMVNFTPHLIPMNRGELVSVYARAKVKAPDIRAAFANVYKEAPFVRLAEQGVIPSTRHVRGSNHIMLAAFDDRLAGRVILFAALDNLVKGSSGQAIQNMNLMFNFPETLGLEQQPLMP